MLDPAGPGSVLLAALDAVRVPHAAPLGELLAARGTRRSSFHDVDVLAIDDAAPLLDGQLRPFERNVGPPYPPERLPAASWTTWVATSDEPRASHARALEALTARFGEPRDVSVSNTVAHAWSLGTSAVRLTTWPAELQPRLPNPAWDRHPELRRSAHLTVLPGHLPALDAEERRALAEVTPLELPDGASPQVLPRLDDEATRGATRLVPPDLRRPGPVVGLAGDAVVGLQGSLGFVVARREVRALRLVRLRPARGPGGSTLALGWDDPWSIRAPLRWRTLVEGRSDLGAIAGDLSRRLAVELSTEDADDD